MRQYFGLIHKETTSDYGVSFPDFPGLVTAGISLDDARVMAKEALAFHIEGMIEDGETVPEASTLKQLVVNRDNVGGIPILVGIDATEPQ